MGKARSTEGIPDLREFIKENDQRLYDFCHYMLSGGVNTDELVLLIFREFGDRYRRMAGRSWERLETRVQLFKLAWERIREAMLHAPPQWTTGRDTRQLQGLDEDLLRLVKARKTEGNGWDASVLERLGRVDPDFRAPVVLRDVLKFEDEEVVRILGVRWGVYRHRLHRGRLDLKEGLRGRVSPADSKGSLSV